MRRFKWWHLGLLGGAVLSLATLLKVVLALPRLFSLNAPWSEFLWFPIEIFVMGFACGVSVWAALPIAKRIGMVGDAIVGIVTMLFFFLLCMLIFDRSLLTPDPTRGLPLFGLAIVCGAILGVWVGRDLRKFVAEQKRLEEQGKSAEPKD